MECGQQCRCENGSECDPVSGKCSCPSGWTGTYCDVPCPPGTFGENCQERSSCQEGQSEQERGDCVCVPGYKGVLCEKTCSPGSYGLHCQHGCECGGNSLGCDHVTGECECRHGWRGAACDSICEEGTWGQDCSLQCNCGPHGDSCHPGTGACRCRPGYTGTKCQDTCQPGSFGLDCGQVCPTCNTSDSCHPSTGACHCSPGWRGYYCMEPCPPGHYGPDCSSVCPCRRGDCHHVTGECRCPGGWTGDLCDTPCSPGTFGPDCAHSCYCLEGGQCNPVDGRCKCSPGHSGYRCENFCPDGYYGEDCSTACTCSSDSFLCHPVLGCVCQPRYSGPNCSTPLSMYSQYLYTGQDPTSTTGAGAVYIGVFVCLLIFIAAATLIFLRFRSGLNILKSQHASGYYSETGECQPLSHSLSFLLHDLHSVLFKVALADREDSYYSLPVLRPSPYRPVPGQGTSSGPATDSYSNSDHLNPLYTTFTGPSPSGSSQRLTPGPTSVLSGVPRIEGNNPVLVSTWLTLFLSVSPPDCPPDNIYEELPKTNLQTSEGGEEEPGEEYDHLDFHRPLNELKPQYLSSSSLRSSRDSESPGKERGLEVSDSSSASRAASDMDLCEAVLGSFEKLNASQSRSRKTVYQP